MGTVHPWRMTVEEFTDFAKGGRLHETTDRRVPGEESASTPIRFGELNGYSYADIVHFYIVRRGGFPNLSGNPAPRPLPEAAADAFEQFITDALDEGKDVAREAIEWCRNRDKTLCEWQA